MMTHYTRHVVSRELARWTRTSSVWGKENTILSLQRQLTEETATRTSVSTYVHQGRAREDFKALWPLDVEVLTVCHCVMGSAGKCSCGVTPTDPEGRILILPGPDREAFLVKFTKYPDSQ